MDHNIKLRKDLCQLLTHLEKNYGIALVELLTLAATVLKNPKVLYVWKDPIEGGSYPFKIHPTSLTADQYQDFQLVGFAGDQVAEWVSITKGCGCKSDEESMMDLFMQCIKYIISYWEAGFILRDESSNAVGSEIYKRIHKNDSPLMKG